LKPTRCINVVGHFTKPQLRHSLFDLLGWRSKHHALATAARQKRKHQTRALWRATVHTAPHFEGAVPALQPREVSFQDLKFLAPNEGRIAKDPQILRCGPIRQDGLERGRCEGLVTPIGGGEGGLFQN